MTVTARRLGRLFCCLALGLSAAFSFAADPAKTIIADTIYRADGTPASGTLLLSWSAFITAEGKPVAAGSMNVKIGPSGAINLPLLPTQGATPAGSYYKVVMKLDDGASSTEYWSVPTLSPTTIAAIRSSVVPASVALQVVSREYVDAADAFGVHKSGDETIAGVKTFAASPLVPEPALAGAAANKGYVDTAVAGSSANILDLNKGGTGNAIWSAARCVRVASDGSMLESSAGDCGADLAGKPVNAASPAAGQQLTFDGTSWSAQDKPLFDVRDYGAKGDGTTDDTAAIQAALDAAYHCTNCNGGGGRVVFPPGKYKVTSPLVFGNASSTLNGAVIGGESSGKAAEIHYAGATSGAALQIINCQWCRAENLNIYDDNINDDRTLNSQIGLWWDVSNTGAGAHNHTESIVVSGFVDGVRIGHNTVSDVNGFPANSFTNLTVMGAHFAVHIIGANTDGEFFYNYSGNVNDHEFRCESCRNLKVDGIEVSNNSGTTVQQEAHLMIWADGGNIGGGGYTFSNARIELGSMFAWFGEQEGSNDRKRPQLVLDNITNSSSRTYAAISAPGTVTATPSSSGGSLTDGTYYFKVTALDGALGETLPATESSATVSGGDGHGIVTLTWAAVTRAAYYRVYWSKDSAGGENRWRYVWASASPGFTLTALSNVSEAAGVPPTTATQGSRSCMVHWGQDGTLTIRDSTFVNPGSFVEAAVPNNTATTVRLESNLINNSNPDAVGSTLSLYSNNPVGQAEDGGLIYISNGNIATYSDATFRSLYRNRIVKYTQKDAVNGTETLLADFSTGTIPTLLSNMASISSLTLGPTALSSIAGAPLLWYKPESLTSATAWPDSGTGGHNLSVTSGTPALAPNAVNNFSAIDFTNGGAGSIMSASGFTIPQPYTMCGVFAKHNASDSRMVIASSATNHVSWGYINNGSPNMLGVATTSPEISITQTADTNFHVFCASTASGVTTLFYRGGSAAGSTGSTSAAGFALAGDPSASGYNFLGMIAEAAVWPVALSRTEMAAVIDSLQFKYALDGTPSWWNPTMPGALYAGLNADELDGKHRSDFLPSTTILPASEAGASHQWINAYNATTGAFTTSQPAKADLSDAGAVAGVGNCPANQYETGDATGGPTCAQVAYSQVSGAPTAPRMVWDSTAQNNLGQAAGAVYGYLTLDSAITITRIDVTNEVGSTGNLTGCTIQPVVRVTTTAADFNLDVTLTNSPATPNYWTATQSQAVAAGKILVAKILTVGTTCSNVGYAHITVTYSMQ